jgi:hypothetical protein
VRAGRTVAAMKSTESRWSLASKGNRVMYAAVLGLLAFATSRSIVLGAIIGGLTYLIASLFAPRS